MQDLWKVTTTWKDPTDGQVHTHFYGHVVIKDLPSWRLLHRVAGNMALVSKDERVINLYLGSTGN